MDLRPLDRDYQVLGPLGRGAAGVVLRARECTTGREVALKCLTTSSPGRLARFVREGQVAASLSDPAIVTVHAIGTLQGLPCLAYQLIPNARPLTEAFQDWSLAQRLTALLEVARALGVAHAAGLIHRDIKGENVLVDDGDAVYVADFGLATGEDLDRLTATGAIVGTPLFMSPEQASSQPCSPATDVWALGVLLYVALCGRTPFEGAGSLLELCTALASGHFERPSQVSRDVDPALESVCVRALERDPTQRHADGASFASALGKAIASPLRQRERRVRPVVGAALAPLLAGLVAAWATGSRGSSPSPAAQPSARPSASLAAASPTPPPAPLYADWGHWAPGLRVAHEVGPPPPPQSAGPPASLVTATRLVAHELVTLDLALSANDPSHAPSLAIQLEALDRNAEGLALDWLRWGVRRGHDRSRRLLTERLISRARSPKERAEGFELLIWGVVHVAQPLDFVGLWKATLHSDRLGDAARKALGLLPPLRRAKIALAVAKANRKADPAHFRLLFTAWRDSTDPLLDVGFARRLQSLLALGPSGAEVVSAHVRELALPREQRVRWGLAILRFKHGLDSQGLSLLLDAVRAGSEAALELVAEAFAARLERSSAALEVVERLEAYADSERPRMLFRLGQAYRHGLRRAADVPRAKAVFERAYRFALVTHEPQPLKPTNPLNQPGRLAGAIALELAAVAQGEKPDDLAVSIPWLQRACEHGAPQAFVRLAHRYRDGRGVPQSTARCQALLEAGAAAGDAQAMWNLADHYRGQHKRLPEAYVYMKRAAELGSTPALERAGDMILRGQGVDRDPAQAAAFYRRAAAQGSKRSAKRLGLLYLRGVGVERDVEKARRLFLQASSAGKGRRAVAAELGEVELALGNTKAALAHWRAGVSRGEPYAALRLSIHVEANNPEEARRLALLAVPNGPPAARAHLGRLLALGIGGPRDLEQARRELRIARDAGDADAATLLRSLKTNSEGADR